MGAFLYRCLITGLNVQGWTADDPAGTGPLRSPLASFKNPQRSLLRFIKPHGGDPL
jgi:hypothetical protein